MAELELVRFVRHPLAWRRTFQSWSGPVGTRLAVATKAVAVNAKATAPKDTGELAAGHVTSFGYHGAKRDLESAVVAIPEQAIFVIKGTQPHVIKARRRPYLVFFWAKVGHVVRMKSVNHPGHPAPNNYLFASLKRIIKLRF